MEKLLLELGLITDCVELPYRARDNFNVRYKRDNVTDIIFTNDIDKVNKDVSPNEITADDKRRAEQWRDMIAGKWVLDYGCGAGGFIELVNDYQGAEAGILGYDELTQNDKKVLKDKYDVITMFHVLEHLENPLDTLEKLRDLLKTDGMIIIEVPHARDALMSVDNYMRHALWSQHLIYHTRQSLKTFLYASGFNHIEIYGYQRYDIKNHLKWMIDGRVQGIPGGLITGFDIDHKKALALADKTDTLIAVASR